MFCARNGLEQLKAYDMEEAALPVKLDANELPGQFDCELQQIIIKKLSSLPLNRYPQIAASNLRQQLADGHGLSKENILVGNGSSELLGALCFAFGGKGRKIIYPHPSFSMYGVYASLSDSEAIAFPLDKTYQVPVKQFADKIKQTNPSLVILCNPNNPTGDVMLQEDIEYIVKNANCPVVVDEAYYEFYGQSSLPLLTNYPNLVITRTFSKAYGLAAARIGYLAAQPPITDVVGKVLLPYHSNALSLAIAEVVYDNRDRLIPSVKAIVAERERLSDSLQSVRDIQVFPSQTNFLLLQLPRATELTQWLKARGISVRDFSKYPELENCIRVTVGTIEENNRVAEAIQTFFKRG